MVIQEALTCGRPLVVSDIGGMAEKVQDGVTGVHVQAGNALAWRETLSRLSGFLGEWDALREGIVKPGTHAECVDLHLQTFNREVARQL